jgi:hypothetical protein
MSKTETASAKELPAITGPDPHLMAHADNCLTFQYEAQKQTWLKSVEVTFFQNDYCLVQGRLFKLLLRTINQKPGNWEIQQR